MLGEHDYPDLADQRFRAIVARWEDVTLLSVERLWSLYQSVEYVTRRGVPGAILECGTFKGGSIGLILETLLAHDVDDREVYLFDTFDGFPDDVNEVMINGESFRREDWVTESFRADVEANLDRTGYPRFRIHLCAGRVEDTIPAHAPGEIALMHLDTDYYRSTLHQLTHLYPRLTPGGFLQVDDYGHFLGCRRAVDEYFATERDAPFLGRVDYTGRAGVKPSVETGPDRVAK